MLVNGEDTATPGNALKILIHSLLEKQNCDAARRSHKIGVRVHTPISTTFFFKNCIHIRGVMIPAVESIPESDFGHFLEFSDSDSDSNSIPQLS